MAEAWDRIISNLVARQGRVSTGLLLIAAVVWGLNPDFTRPLDIGRAAAITAAAIVWLFAELSGVEKPSDHDIALFKRINETLDNNALTFLREHDFHINFHSRMTEPIHDMAGWHGADVEFTDSKLQRQWSRVFALIDKQSNLYAAILVARDHVDILTPYVAAFDRHHQPAHVMEEIKELNETATAIYKAFYSFSGYARRRLRL